MKGNRFFIEQTAKDYDMKYEDVDNIYSKYPIDLFYEKLEELIKERDYQQV